MRSTLFASALGAAMLSAAPIGAQVARGQLDVSAGVATDQRGVRSNAVTIAPTLIYTPDDRVAATFAVNATQYGAQERSVGGSGNISMRQPLGRSLHFGLGAAGSYIGTSFDASYGAAEVLPTLESTIGGVTLFAGGHFAAGRTSIGTSTASPGGILGGGTTTRGSITASRSMSGAVLGAAMSFRGLPAGQSGGANYREEHAAVEGTRLVDRTATAGISTSALALSASAGYRSASDEKRGFGSVSATMSLSRALGLQASVGSYPSNRVLGVVGGRYASIGLSFRGRKQLDTRAAPVVAIKGAPSVPAGATRFFVTAPRAQRVEIAGDWSDWTPIPATRADDGTWYADIKLSRGEYRYAFRIDSQKWDVPKGVPAIDDGYGGRSALVSIR